TCRSVVLISQILSLVPFPYTSPVKTNNYTLSLHDALPILSRFPLGGGRTSWCGFLSSGYSLDVQRTCWLGSTRTLHIQAVTARRSEEHTSELQSRSDLVCRLLLEKKNLRQW